MKTFVINLDSRPDRLAFISNQLKNVSWVRHSALNGHNLTIADFKRRGFTPYVQWVDPMLSRRLTNTEIATAISHYELWNNCALTGENYLILEDDSELIGTLDLAKINELLDVYDIVYLDYKEMFPQKVVDLGDGFIVPYYAYWNNAYAISPRLAKKIIQSKYNECIIPVDELFPLLNGVNYNETCLGVKKQFDYLQEVFKNEIGIKSIAYKESIFKQVPRKILGSDIENGKVIMSNNINVVTVATDLSRLSYLTKSTEKFNISYTNLGDGVVWNGGTMQGPGGGQKINLVKQHLQTMHDDDIMLFVDGYDVFFNDDLNTILERFKGFNCNILLSAEVNCWPDPSLASFFESHTKYKYLNSGLYMGYVKDLKRLLVDDIKDSDDDQLYLQKRYIANKFNPSADFKIELDVENYIFQCLAFAAQDVKVKENKQLINTDTRCCPCIVHGNGGPSQKSNFDNIFNNIFDTVPQSNTSGGIELIAADKFDVVGPEILEMDFLTPEMCKKLIDKAEAHGKWESMYGDKFPGQEMRIREFDMDFFNLIEEHFKNVINPKIEQYWWPLQMYGIRDAFIIKYSMDKQTSLSCHHDASLVTGNVKLNEDYEGADTYFHRQNFSNINTPAGRITLWPGQVTHGHEGRPLHSGTKYNLVIWTCRKKGDTNY